MNVDELELSELYDCEDELIRLYRKLGLGDSEYKRMVNLTKREFRKWRDVLRYRDKIKRELKNNGKF